MSSGYLVNGLDYDEIFVRKGSLWSSAYGNLWAWGGDQYGELANNVYNLDTDSPTQVAGSSNWKKIDSGASSILAIDQANKLWAWGLNDGGQLGIGSPLISRSSPVQVSAVTEWSDVSSGLRHTSAIKTDGTLWSWGYNLSGQLGDNTTLNKWSPIQVGMDTNWTQVSCSQDYSLAIKTDGSLWAWGENVYGCLGDSTFIYRSSPIQIGPGNDWKQVSAGSHCTGAVKQDGTLWMWGLNDSGELGTNNDWNFLRSSPVQTIAGGNNWKQVKLGAYDSRSVAAIKYDGTLWGWGLNNRGQLGDGTRINRSSPVQTIAGGTNWMDVSVGEMHTAAIKTDGTLWTWGNTGWGQLGDANNGYVNRSSPAQITPGITSWKFIACSKNSTFGIR